jgi:hypothetical protein
MNGDTDMRSNRLIAFMPLVVILMAALTYVAVFAVDSTAGRIAVVIAILAIATAFSSAMLINGRSDTRTRR